MSSFFNIVPVRSSTEEEVSSPSSEKKPEKLIAKPSSGSGVFDVIQSCRFTGNDIPPALKNKIPYCILKEHRLTTNAAISLASYFLNQDGGEAAVQNSINELTSQLNLDPNRRIPELRDIPSNVGLEGAPDITKRRAIQSISEKLGYNPLLKQGAGSGLAPEPNTENFYEFPLSVYSGLYLTKPTGFQYILPFFNSSRTDISNEFSSTQDKNTGGYFSDYISRFDIKQALTSAGGSYEQIAQTIQPTQPGVYIENPKFYNFNRGNESYDIEFTLINTYDPGTSDNSMIKRHHDFIFLLTFQNLPFRRTFTNIDPPKIYSFTIPGQIYLPYAFISKLTVEFVGNRRLISITSPDGSGTRDTIIPEAYLVRLTVAGLTAPAGNFMLAKQLSNIKTNTIGIDGEPINPVYTAGGSAIKPPDPLPTKNIGILPGSGGETNFNIFLQ